MLAPELKNQVRKLWDKFWAGGIANPLPAIEQITYLIFMKRLEVLDKQRQEEGKPSIFDGPDDLRRWSKFKYLSAEDTGPKGLLPHVRDTVFPFIQSLNVLGDAFVHEMRDAVFMIPKPSLLSEAIMILDSLFDQQRHVLAGRNADILGDIYEHLLSEIRTAGKNGQFRTPRHIIRAIIELIDPKPGERICDPAFGTGGFLVNSYQHMLKMHTARDSLVFDADGTPHNLDGDLLGDGKRFLTGCNFVGYDFDRTMVRLGLMNMVLHGIDDPHGRYADTLSQRFTEARRYDVVMTNPPFTGSIDKADKSDRFALDTNKTELLFIELLLDLLVPGGRAGVIVPEGVLFGSTRAHRELRRRLVWDNQLDAVISLPVGVFQPYTGVKTSILIFTKGEDQDEQRAEPLTKKVWL